jgi:hypothetical protein
LPATITASAGAHTHVIDPPTTRSGNETVNHSHSVDPPNTNTTSNSHNHSLNVREGTGEGDGYFLDTNPGDSGTNKTLTGTVTSTYAHTHAVNIAALGRRQRVIRDRPEQRMPKADPVGVDGHESFLLGRLECVPWEAECCERAEDLGEPRDRIGGDDSHGEASRFGEQVETRPERIVDARADRWRLSISVHFSSNPSILKRYFVRA